MADNQLGFFESINSVISICIEEKSKDPIYILKRLMSEPFCRMHGPEHHTLVGFALLCAYKNSDGRLELEASLREMYKRSKSIPGGVCAMWGACGAAISSGIYVSIVTGSSPLSDDVWRMPLKMTSLSLDAISRFGGPRCCKRDSYISIIKAAEFTRQYLNVKMDTEKPICSHYHKNQQCLKRKCPFYKSEK